jgi:hypothetical protein
MLEQRINSGQIGRNAVSIQFYCEAVPRTQMLTFPFYSTMCECRFQRRGEAVSIDFIGGFITDNFRLISVPNKIPDVPKEELS